MRAYWMIGGEVTNGKQIGSGILEYTDRVRISPVINHTFLTPCSVPPYDYLYWISRSLCRTLLRAPLPSVNSNMRHVWNVWLGSVIHSQGKQESSWIKWVVT